MGYSWISRCWLQRTFTPSESTVAYVDGFRLHIGKRATLLPDAKSRAYGVLMKITAGEAAALYSEESVADYVAETVVVNLSDDNQVSAVCYNLPATKLAGTNPEYAAALLTLAGTLGLPDSYLEHIRSAGAGTWPKIESFAD